VLEISSNLEEVSYLRSKMEKNQTSRLPAYKLPISHIMNNPYIREEGEFSPNYIQIANLKVSRTNIIGVVVSDYENNSLTIDDGTSKITIRAFEQTPLPSEISVGDIINIIGRPREFSSEKYLVPEIIKKIDKGWMEVRKLEIMQQNLPSPEKKEIKQTETAIDTIKEETIEEPKENITNSHENIIDHIRKNDQGNGVEIESIISALSLSDCEKIIESMLKEGDIFENIPGKLKVLE
jgi:RPA family protein